MPVGSTPDASSPPAWTNARSNAIAFSRPASGTGPVPLESI
jgi:hypothetical protein